MPKNKVSDPITDQEIAFARLILSGTMTDRQAAQTAGLHPESAAYTKAKPHVRAYMLEHRAAVEQKLVQQEADGLHRFNLDREQVLARLWEIAHLSPEMTRGSITGQVKALSMIVAMQNLIPDPRAVSAGKQSAPAPAPQINQAASLRKQQATTIDPRPSPARAPEEDTQEDSPDVSEPESAPGSEEEASPNPGPSQSTLANRRIPFSIKKNPFARRLR